MKIRFVKDLTVDIMDPNTGEIHDCFFRYNTIIDVEEIVIVSKGFSNLYLPSGECLIDIRNDSFEKVL